MARRKRRRSKPGDGFRIGNLGAPAGGELPRLWPIVARCGAIPARAWLPPSAAPAGLLGHFLGGDFHAPRDGVSGRTSVGVSSGEQPTIQLFRLENLKKMRSFWARWFGIGSDGEQQDGDQQKITSKSSTFTP